MTIGQTEAARTAALALVAMAPGVSFSAEKCESNPFLFVEVVGVVVDGDGGGGAAIPAELAKWSTDPLSLLDLSPNQEPSIVDRFELELAYESDTGIVRSNTRWRRVE